MATFAIAFQSVATPGFAAPVIPPASQAAITFAAQVWGRKINSNQQIRVLVNFYDNGAIPQPLTALCVPNGVLLGGTWYASALADHLMGADQQPGVQDLSVHINLDPPINWNFDYTQQPFPNQLDLATVALHELCHGLGFVSLFNVIGGVGSYGAINAAMLPPVVAANLGFGFPNLNNLPCILDTEVVNAAGQALVNNPAFGNGSPGLGAQLIVPGLVYNVPAPVLNGVAANLPPVQTNNPFLLFTSLTHFVQTPGVLMVGAIPNGQVITAPDPFTCAVMSDIGWTLNP